MLKFGSGVGELSLAAVVQVWNPDEWEIFAFGLLQDRHGPLNVQKVPAAHKGDVGMDYYCVSDAVVYQCYAVVEPVDISTRADRQKTKITNDLKKLVDNEATISKLFLGNKIEHWKLLAPLHDSRQLNDHCSKKTLDMRALGCGHLAPNFLVDIQDTGSFPATALNAGMNSLGSLNLLVPSPSEEEVEGWQSGATDLLVNATKKLQKRVSEGEVEAAVSDTVSWFLEGNALLDALRSSAPDLHEKVLAAVSSRERRLKFAGPPTVGKPDAILRTEWDDLISALKDAAPNLSSKNVDQLAAGAISEWILRCPLDFPPYAS